MRLGATIKRLKRADEGSTVCVTETITQPLWAMLVEEPFLTYTDKSRMRPCPKNAWARSQASCFSLAWHVNRTTYLVLPSPSFNIVQEAVYTLFVVMHVDARKAWYGRESISRF